MKDARFCFIPHPENHVREGRDEWSSDGIPTTPRRGELKGAVSVRAGGPIPGIDSSGSFLIPGINILIVVIWFLLSPGSAFGESGPLTVEQAVSIGQEYLQAGPLYTRLDQTRKPRAEALACKDNKYSYSCGPYNHQPAQQGYSNYWVLEYALKPEQAITLNIGNLQAYWLLIDLDTGKVVEKDDFETQWMVTYLLQKMWAGLEGEKQADIFQAGYFLYWYQGEHAKQLNASLTEFPWMPDEIFKYQLLNDLGAAFYIMGEASYWKQDYCVAKKIFKMLIDDFGYAQIYSSR
ncbi:MAG: hypothetical protein A4E71_00512 [Smithella sp. PtaU1.Bin162]|nr:MAG: hypothetical protein A4E71_00512 [Smithella sp. PtaU1.Bin162]